MKHLFILINFLFVLKVNATGLQDKVFFNKNYCYSLCSYDDKLVVGTSYGIQIRNVNSNAVELLNYENIGLPARIVFSVDHSNDGTIWLGCDSGLIKLKGQTFYRYDMSNSPMPGNLLKFLPAIFIFYVKIFIALMGLTGPFFQVIFILQWQLIRLIIYTSQKVVLFTKYQMVLL